MEHAADGLFNNAAITTWNRGTQAEVIWASGANHRGMKAPIGEMLYHFCVGPRWSLQPTVTYHRCQLAWATNELLVADDRPPTRTNIKVR